MSQWINKPIVKLTEKPIPHTQNVAQLKVALKVLIPESSSRNDKIIPIPDYEIPQTRSTDDSSSRMIKRKSIHDISWENPIYPDPIHRPSPEPTEIPLQV